MKIAFVNTEFLPIPAVKGGAVEGWIEQIAKKLELFNVYVFSRGDGDFGLNSQEEHISYFHFRENFIDKLLLSTYKLPFKNGSSKLFYWPYSYWCARKLSKIKPDVIHVHNRPHFVWILKKLNPKAKIILHVHQMSVIEEKTLWNKKLLENVDLFLGCSEFIANQIKKKFPESAEKVSFVYNGLKMEDFPFFADEKIRRKELRHQFGLDGTTTILYVGRLAENKGVHLLIKAVTNILKKKNKNLKLIICGARGYANREMTPYIKKLYRLTKGFEDNIFFTGQVAHNQIRNFYLMSDLVAIPSEVAEGFCMITIEAMATGIPVLASNRGGIPEVLDHGNYGHLVDDVSVKGFESKISEILKTKTDSTEFTRRARESVEERFRWHCISQKLEGLYRGLRYA